MNDTINREESPLANFMAVVGLLVMIVLLAWLAVQLVRFVPTIFSRLAVVFDENQRQLDDQSGDDNVVVVTDPEPETESPAAEDEEEDSEIPEEDDSENESESPVADETSSTGTGSRPATSVQYRTVTTYQIPVSDPNGYTDLQATFVAVGIMSSGASFTPTSYLEREEQSALQFKVKNVGTKTSGQWSFKAELPDGSTVTSKSQLPLKPSETATLTVVFDGVSKKSDDTAVVSVAGGNDTNLANNNFRVTIEVR